MMRKVTNFAFFVLLVFILSFTGNAQIPGLTPVLIDSSSTWRYINGYRGGNEAVFYEPTSGNLVVSWYYQDSNDPDPRRITAATSTDGGQTWSVFKNINLGTGTSMNGYYPNAHGNATTPILVYYNRANPNQNIVSQPTMAEDALGWGGGLWENTYIDAIGTADTVLDFRYNTMAIAPDNPNLWIVGGIHYRDSKPGEYLSIYRSENGGINWSRPIPVISSVPTDINKPSYVYDLYSTTMVFSIGANNKVYGVSQAQYSGASDIWRAIFVTSNDGGKTWTKPAFIPGTENLEFTQDDVYRNFESIIDAAGNWHVFAIGVDIKDSKVGTLKPYRAWDFRFNGSEWTINKFVYPQLVNDGIAATGVTNTDEEDPLNGPALGPDGTLYFGYSDVVDTTGGGGSPLKYNYGLFVMVSENNGTTWKGPVEIFSDPAWKSDYPNGVAKHASDKLHFIYLNGENENGVLNKLYYLAIPTAEIKARLTSVPDASNDNRPEAFALFQNYPNPFNSTTSIRFDLKEDAEVTITVYNALGQKVATLAEGNMTAGYKGVVWEATHLPSGTYLFRLKAGDLTFTKEMTLLK